MSAEYQNKSAVLGNIDSDMNISTNLNLNTNIIIIIYISGTTPAEYDNKVGKKLRSRIRTEKLDL